MSLPEEIQKIKGFFTFHKGPLGTAVHILLLLGVGLGSYFIGLKSPPENAVAVFSPSAEALPLSSATLPQETLSNQTESETQKGEGAQAFVASSKGTKYHRADCPGAATIKTENKISFATEDEARKAGYAPAGNCPGLK